MRPLQESDVFHAIAHPTRRSILVALKKGERPASDLAEPLMSKGGVSFGAISQHLKVLRDAKLVTERRDGRRRLYRLRPKPLEEVVTWASKFEAYFDERLDALEAHLDRTDKKR